MKLAGYPRIKDTVFRGPLVAAFVIMLSGSVCVAPACLASKGAPDKHAASKKEDAAAKKDQFVDAQVAQKFLQDQGSSGEGVLGIIAPLVSITTRASLDAAVCCR